MTPGEGIEPRLHWWETRALELTTAPATDFAADPR